MKKELEKIVEEVMSAGMLNNPNLRMKVLAQKAFDLGWNKRKREADIISETAAEEGAKLDNLRVAFEKEQQKLKEVEENIGFLIHKGLRLREHPSADVAWKAINELPDEIWAEIITDAFKQFKEV